MNVAADPIVRRVRPKYQVFISSTYGDLREEREKTSWEILKARHVPAGMEAFPATDDRGWNIIQRTIDSSDYYVLLIAGRYGTVDPDTNLSWTEREYRYARSRGIPVLAFLRERPSITADKIEEDPSNAERLASFLVELKRTHLYKMWTTGDDLCAKVGAALRAQIDEDEESGLPRPGWYRGDQLPSAATMEEFARTSAENAALRKQLEVLQKGSPVLELRTLAGHVLADQFETVWARVKPGTSIRGEIFRSVFQLRVHNVGAATATSVAVEFRFHRATLCYFHDDEPTAPFVTEATVDLRGQSRHIHIERLFVHEGDVVVIQRVRSVGPGSDEALLRMVPEFVFDATDAVGTSRTFDVSYRVTSEVSPAVVGTLKIHIDVRQLVKESGTAT